MQTASAHSTDASRSAAHDIATAANPTQAKPESHATKNTGKESALSEAATPLALQLDTARPMPLPLRPLQLPPLHLPKSTSLARPAHRAKEQQRRSRAALRNDEHGRAFRPDAACPRRRGDRCI